MTYCLAMRLDDGLVVMSDTRTNAGVDNIGSYRTLHVLAPAADRVFVLQSAGNLGTTQEVLDRIHVDIEKPGDHESLLTVSRMFEPALYIGRLGQEVNQRHRNDLNMVGADGTATFILGGQIAGFPADILLVYPEGNYIRASDDRPFLQIGEAKFGKFPLEMAVEADAGLVTASKIAIGSMKSTARANLAVGPPYDLAAYAADSVIEVVEVVHAGRVLDDLEHVSLLQSLRFSQNLGIGQNSEFLQRQGLGTSQVPGQGRSGGCREGRPARSPLSLARRPALPRRRNLDDDVADLLAGLDISVGLDDLVQRVAPVDDWLEGP
jgi:putative proteasome-type protease